jgi:hypothetical protein
LRDSDRRRKRSSVHPAIQRRYAHAKEATKLFFAVNLERFHAISPYSMPRHCGVMEIFEVSPFASQLANGKSYYFFVFLT